MSFLTIKYLKGQILQSKGKTLYPKDSSVFDATQGNKWKVYGPVSDLYEPGRAVRLLMQATCDQSSITIPTALLKFKKLSWVDEQSGIWSLETNLTFFMTMSNLYALTQSLVKCYVACCMELPEGHKDTLHLTITYKLQEMVVYIVIDKFRFHMLIIINQSQSIFGLWFLKQRSLQQQREVLVRVNGRNMKIIEVGRLITRHSTSINVPHTFYKFREFGFLKTRLDRITFKLSRMWIPAGTVMEVTNNGSIQVQW
ncbi:hypothetical protein BDK51DRAFT_31123 [Blyttiomyces helicus]|uniref:Uncharacterized protein n=1 Tax=Blyttiomyces helicus TaxID=388810 RepID=A0A4P9WH00_9FUNG|nr:hypothetical protein BDK51DRAFT_31123 [Blyttiomyces helicus]|eukprot:RKO91215.1 hypothetical protein BDK51DRAFT_31123 [Blyttiomyces helicus]